MTFGDSLARPGRSADSSVEILDECLVADICIDRYLWALYLRTPKMDTIKVHEQRKVTVKKKGKLKTVTKSFTKLVDPPHLAPIDGKEYAAHRREPKDQQAGSGLKKHNRVAVQEDRSVAKTPKNRKIVEGENGLKQLKHAFKQDAGSKATKLKWLPISRATAPARAGSAARYTNQRAISGRPTMAALKRS